MKERSLVAFTILAQMAVGAFWVLGALHIWATRQIGMAAADALTDRVLLAISPLMILGLLASFFHLGTPLNAWRAFANPWRAFANLRSSWLSREALCAVLFTGTSGLFTSLQWFKVGTLTARNVVAWAAALIGLALIISMANAYRVRTVPAWNTWVTPVSFFTTAFLLGELAVGVTLVVNSDVPPELLRSSLRWIGLSAIVLLGVQLVIILLWVAKLAAGQGAALHAAARIIQEHRLIFRLRLVLAIVGIAVAGVTLSPWGEGTGAGITTILTFGLALISEILGRLLFYAARVRHGV
ncbi:MAG: DmsC/YnfH family molybdoenzyme membrane anchor subunit [Anaerolineae bacterium]